MCAPPGYIYPTKQMLKLIAKFVGKPRDESELAFVTNPKAQKFMEDLPEYPPADLRRRFPSAGADAVDLLARMLVMRPDRRLSVDEALRHPYLRSLRDKKVNERSMIVSTYVCCVSFVVLFFSCVCCCISLRSLFVVCGYPRVCVVIVVVVVYSMCFTAVYFLLFFHFVCVAMSLGCLALCCVVLSGCCRSVCSGRWPTPFVTTCPILSAMANATCPSPLSLPVFPSSVVCDSSKSTPTRPRVPTQAETTALEPVDFADVELAPLNKNNLRRLMHEDVLAYRPELRSPAAGSSLPEPASRTGGREAARDGSSSHSRGSAAAPPPPPGGSKGADASSSRMGNGGGHSGAGQQRERSSRSDRDGGRSGTSGRSSGHAGSSSSSGRGGSSSSTAAAENGGKTDARTHAAARVRSGGAVARHPFPTEG